MRFCLQAEALITAMERLRAKISISRLHQLIYEAMVELGEANEPIDLVTLTADLQDQAAAGGDRRRQLFGEAGQFGSDGGECRLLCADRRREVDAAPVDPHGDANRLQRLCQRRTMSAFC